MLEQNKTLLTSSGYVILGFASCSLVLTSYEPKCVNKLCIFLNFNKTTSKGITFRNRKKTKEKPILYLNIVIVIINQDYLFFY